jgi:hypothetical protein
MGNDVFELIERPKLAHSNLRTDEKTEYYCPRPIAGLMEIRI